MDIFENYANDQRLDFQVPDKLFFDEIENRKILTHGIPADSPTCSFHQDILNRNKNVTPMAWRKNFGTGPPVAPAAYRPTLATETALLPMCATCERNQGLGDTPGIDACVCAVLIAKAPCTYCGVDRRNGEKNWARIQRTRVCPGGGTVIVCACGAAVGANDFMRRCACCWGIVTAPFRNFAGEEVRFQVSGAEVVVKKEKEEVEEEKWRWGQWHAYLEAKSRGTGLGGQSTGQDGNSTLLDLTLPHTPAGPQAAVSEQSQLQPQVDTLQRPQNEQRVVPGHSCTQNNTSQVLAFPQQPRDKSGHRPESNTCHAQQVQSGAGTTGHLQSAGRVMTPKPTQPAGNTNIASWPQQTPPFSLFPVGSNPPPPTPRLPNIQPGRRRFAGRFKPAFLRSEVDELRRLGLQVRVYANTDGHDVEPGLRAAIVLYDNRHALVTQQLLSAALGICGLEQRRVREMVAVVGDGGGNGIECEHALRVLRAGAWI